MDDDELISPDNPDDDSAEDELRYAPRDAADAPETVESSADKAQVEESIFEDAPAEDLMPMAPEVDLDAALAAVSTLDDMLAEQEAAEQAEIARQQAEIEAEAQREARLKNPEFFFPMPPLLGIQRGRMDSVIPALALIVLGIWLTFTLTSGAEPQATSLIIAVAVALAISLLGRWLASGRWAQGALFFGLMILLTGALLAALAGNNLLLTAWPLLFVGPGLAFMLTGLLAANYRMLLPGLLLSIGGLAALLVTYPVLPADSFPTLAALWPAAVLILVILLILPMFSRRQRE